MTRSKVARRIGPNRAIARSRGTGEAGTSLLEIVIASLVLTTVAAGLALLASNSTRGTTKSRDRAAALSLAIDKIEEIRNSGTSSMTAGNYSDSSTIDASGDAGGSFSRSWTISDVTLSGIAAKRVSITVTWAGSTVSLASDFLPTATAAAGVDGDAFPDVVLRNWTQVSS